mgnify:CR=1 FL=1
MGKSQIGIIGLATMGANLARNFADKKIPTIVYNRSHEKTENFIKSFANEYLQGSKTLKEFLGNLEKPRKIILLVKAGDPVNQVINELSPLLDKNDIIIDCGNSHFKDTERRQNELAKKSIYFLGCGISGGEEGALKGPSMMPGGDKKAYTQVSKLLEKVTAHDFKNGKCVTYLGPGGSGHFVKMVHNGIEYAIMQLIAETYDILKQIGKLSNPELAKIFTNYGKSENLKSYLLEITAKIFSTVCEANKNNKKVLTSVKTTYSKYLIDFIKDSAGQKGTGKWTTEAALNLGVAIPTINAAVDARIISGDPREMSGKLLKKNIEPLKNLDKKALIKELRDALELATELSYGQGFLLLMKASQENSWNLNFSEIARIWQGGCIIRSDYLLKMETALGKNLDQAKKIKQQILQNFNGKKQLHLRSIIGLGAQQGIPLPAFYSTLSYYDSYSAPQLPQNLIQAQRDFFGAHGYERTDKSGSFHTEW